MSRPLALALSVLAHPVFVNLLCLFALFGLFPSLRHGMPDTVKYFYIIFIFVSTSIVPLVLVLLMRLTGKVRSIMLDEASERHLPYLFTLAFYVFDFYNFYRSPGTHPMVLRYLLACTAIMLLVIAVNYYSKISIHLTTLGACAGLVFAAGLTGLTEVRPWLSLLVMLSGFTAAARLSLDAHKPAQLYSGFLMGLAVMVIILRLPWMFN